MGKKRTKSDSKSVNVNKKKNKKLLYLIFGIVIVSLIVFFIFYSNRSWKREGDIVFKGNESYEIGDYYEYDELNGDYSSDETDIKWKVLGVNEKGNLLIISTTSVGDLSLGSPDSYNEGQNAYLIGIDEMNKMTRKYAQGKNAISARSVTVDDIISALSIDVSKIVDYDRKYSYFWDENGELSYKNSFGEEGKLGLSHSGSFTYFDNSANRWKVSTNLSYDNSNQRNDIATIEDESFAFNPYIYNEDLEEYVSLYEVDTKKYKMLFLDERTVVNTYWVADRFVDATANYVAYGFNTVKSDTLNYYYVLYSNGNTRLVTAGVRAVVEIK